MKMDKKQRITHWELIKMSFSVISYRPFFRKSILHLGWIISGKIRHIPANGFSKYVTFLQKIPYNIFIKEFIFDKFTIQH